MTITVFHSDWASSGANAGWGNSQIGTGASFARDTATTTDAGFATGKCYVVPGAVLYGGERAEQALMGVGTSGYENATGDLVHYGFSVMLPSGWDGQQIQGDPNSWCIVFQLHGPDTLGWMPVLAFCAAKRTASGSQQDTSKNR